MRRSRDAYHSLDNSPLPRDWRWGALYFEHALVDHDALVNSGNWKYIAGTGTDVRDTRFDVEQQRLRYDKDGKFVQLWRHNA